MLLRALEKIILREWQYLWYDRALRRIMLLIPLAAVAIFSLTYYNDSILSIPVAVVDLDRSDTSQAIIQELANHENLDIVAQNDDYWAMEKMLADGEIVGGIVIPENLAQDIARRSSPTIYMALDGTNMAYSTNTTAALLEVIGVISARTGVSMILAQQSPQPLIGPAVPQPSLTAAEALSLYMPVNFVDESWFNPALSYRAFLLLVLLINVWQQCCTLLGCTNIIGETGMRSWLQVKSSGFSLCKLFFSKSVAQLIVMFASVVPIYLCAFVVLKLPLNVSLAFLLLFTFVFLLALHALATFMSSIAQDTVDASRFGMLIALPSFLLCGYTWPLEVMPDIVVRIAKLLPQTWFFQGLNYAQFKAASPDLWQHYFLVLLYMAVLFYLLAGVTTWVREKINA